MKNISENETFNGEVVEALPNTMFMVLLEDKRKILCTLTGKMRRRYVRVLPGQIVKVEMTPYDKDRGRIVWRDK